MYKVLIIALHLFEKVSSLLPDYSEYLSPFFRSQELKEIDFFKLINWQDAMNKKLKPPFVPPKGEVHAAETFDIGSFDDDDIKGVKVCK